MTFIPRSSIIEPFITVVSGLPRSGTSMVMHMLKAGGMAILTDHVRSADEDNPRGYFEFEPVKNLARDSSWIPQARGKAVKIISHLLVHLPADEHYKIIFVHRDIREIMVSQQKMLERRGTRNPAQDDAVLLQKFETHLRNIEDRLGNQKHMECLSVQYSDIIAEPDRAAERIRDFLGLPLDTGKMASSVDPGLYRNRG